jgi:hypothetical protein
MTFDPENIPLTLNDWFSTEVVYEGRGRAEFLDPSGVAEGPARVQINENGSSSIKLNVETVEADEALRLGVLQFFSGQKPVEGSGWVGIGGGGGEATNTCTRLMVTTPQGVFSAAEGIRYGYSVGMGDTSAELTFHMLRSQFDAVGERRPKYWVLPLSNFLSKFVMSHPTLDRHPLRFYPTAIIPEGLSETDSLIAAYNANRKNHLITFEFMGQAGFIEPLPDYAKREKSLIDGSARHAITAVMVGEVGSNSIEPDGLKEWFPDDFLRLLSIVTGTPVGSPRVEFRDEQGEMVRRVHMNLNLSPYSKGHRPFEEDVHSGTGYLLTRYQSSQERGKPYLNVILKHLSQAARYDQSIEDKFIYLVRALENLCQQYGFKARHLMQSLDAHWRNEVENILSAAADQIRDAALQASYRGQPGQSRVLGEIARRAVETPGGKENSFGLAVCELLKHFSLPDADIVDAHYMTNPRPDGVPAWSMVLSKYRAIPVHMGFFKVSENVHDFDDVWTVGTHLQDILLRIIFKIIRYDGTYQPPVKTMTSTTSMDWVALGLSARELGYK